MLSRVLTLSVALSTMVIAPMAFADPQAYGRGRYDSDGGARYDYARVIHVEPIVRQVRVETPQRECWDEERYDDSRYDRQQGLAGPTILGGLIGGAIGTRIGRGDGRRAATVAGVLIGSAIARDAAARRRAEQGAYSEPRTVERCDVRYTHSVEERIDGYDVEYEYSGERYHTRLPYDPGDRMRIRVDVTPAEYRSDR